MAAVQDLVVRLGAHTGQFDRRMRHVRGTLAVTTGAVRTLGAAIMTALGPIAGVYGLVRLAGAGEQFNRKMRSALAIMGDVSEALRTKLRRTAIETARVTRYSAAEMGEAYYYLISAGLKVRQSIAALPAVAQFAQAGMFDLARATELATDAQHALGMSAADPTKNLQSLVRVTDVLVKANTLADATVEQFAEALTHKAGAAFKIVGKDVEEVVAVLAALAMAGRKGEEAGTQLSRVMIGLKSNAINNAKAFHRLGVTVFDEYEEMRNLADIVTDLENSIGRMTDKQQQAAIEALGFTKRNADLVALLIGASDKIRRFEEQLRQAGGTTKEVAAKQLTPLEKGWAKLGATVADVGGRLMDWAGPILGRVMTSMSKWGTGIRVTFTLLGDLAKSVSRFFADAFFVAFDYVRKWLAPFQSGFQKAFANVAANLDVLLGSWEGLRAGIVQMTQQTTLAFQALWEQSSSFFNIQLEKMRSWWKIAWLDMQTWLLQTMPSTLHAVYMFGAGVLRALGKEVATLNRETFLALAKERIEDLGAQRIDAEKVANAKIEELERQHQRRMASIGEASLEATAKWEAQLKRLPTLSGRVRDAWEKATKMPGMEKPQLPELPDVGARGAGEAAAQVVEHKYAAAEERDTREAWKTILAAMRPGADPQKELAKHMKEGKEHMRRAADGIDEIKNRGPELVPIPG